jgi:NAD-dependent deacetylase
MKLDQFFLKYLLQSDSLVFFTGAGISAESGIPTFRGKNGIWNKLKPEELANFDAFLRNPQLVWEWYNHRKRIIHESEPNPGHLAIAEMEKIFPGVTVITQNIDNLHRRAGSRNIFELHGNIERNYCIKCKNIFSEEPDFSKGVPQCTCGGLIRPDVVWFGELLPEDQFSASESAARNCDLFFIVGTSGVVYPAASLITLAKQSGARLAEINIEKTEISGLADWSFFGEAGTILPEILNEIKKDRVK